MFFYERIPIPTLIMAGLVITLLLLLNEITRRSKYLSIGMYILLPILLTIFVWPKTAGSGSTSGYWFAWVKTYSALLGIIGFMAIRHIKKLEGSKFMFIFPAFILSFNILEAVYRDYEVYANFNGLKVIENGLTMMGGSWNIINAIAGIISIITITGWVGIKISNTKSRDLVWPDMLWFWVIAYSLWNASYCYNAISDRSFYAGTLLVITAMIAGFFIKKGAWLQHRAQTLALYAMFTLTIPAFASSSQFAVKSSNNPKAMLVLSIVSLIANIAVLVFQIIQMRKQNIKNSFTNDVYTNTASYKATLKENQLD